MKVYRGRRTGTGVEVTVDGAPLDARLELRDFQAGGFEWGYQGSGPSQLALAILAEEHGAEAALGGYRDFVRQVIAELEGDDWTLTSADLKQQHEQIVEVPMDLPTLLRKVRGETDGETD